MNLPCEHGVARRPDRPGLRRGPRSLRTVHAGLHQTWQAVVGFDALAPEGAVTIRTATERWMPKHPDPAPEQNRALKGQRQLNPGSTWLTDRSQRHFNASRSRATGRSLRIRSARFSPHRRDLHDYAALGLPVPVDEPPAFSMSGSTTHVMRVRFPPQGRATVHASGSG